MTKLLLVVLLALGAASYFVFGGGDPAPQREEVTASSPDELSQKMREAFEAGHRVEVVSSVSGGDKSRGYWSRKPSEPEVAKCKKTMSMLLRHSASPKLDGLDVLDKEIQIADAHYTDAVVRAAQQLLDEGKGFVTKGIVMELQSNNDFHYWNTTLPDRKLLYVAVDLKRFPNVLALRQSFYDLRQFKENDRAYVWNSKSVSERKARVDAANAARERLAEMKGEVGPLVKKKKSGTISTAEQVRLDELIRLGEEAQAIIRGVPRWFDPVTFDAK